MVASFDPSCMLNARSCSKHRGPIFEQMAQAFYSIGNHFRGQQKKTFFFQDTLASYSRKQPFFVRTPCFVTFGQRPSPCSVKDTLPDSTRKDQIEHCVQGNTVSSWSYKKRPDWVSVIVYSLLVRDSSLLPFCGTFVQSISNDDNFHRLIEIVGADFSA